MGRNGEGAVKNNFYTSKVPIDPHLAPISLKILDCLTSLDRTMGEEDE